MTITNKITIVFMFMIISLSGANHLMFNYQENLFKNKFTETIVSDKNQIWRRITNNKLDANIQIINKLGKEVAKILTNDTDTNKSIKINELFSKSILENDLNHGKKFIEIFNLERKIEYRSSSNLNPISPVSEKLIEKVLNQKSAEYGFGYNENRHLFLTYIFPIINEKNYEVVGVGVIAESVVSILELLANQTQSHVYIVNRNGGIIEGIDTQVWKNIANSIIIDNDHRLIDLKDGNYTYTATTIPMDKVFNNQKTYLVLLKDTTENSKDILYLQYTYAGSFILIMFLCLWFVRYIMYKSLQPLEICTNVLENLSRGDASHVITSNIKTPEINKMLNAIEILREQLLDLWLVRRSRVKQRLRTEKIIKEEIFKLSDVLDQTDKMELSFHFHNLNEKNINSPDDHQKNNELGSLALTLRKLGTSLISKQSKLNEVIDELKEALATQTRFMAIQKELDIARRVQLSYVPAASFNHEKIELQALLKPSKAVGGDFYDYFMIDDNRLGFLVGDVSDKGVPSALFMMVSKTVLQVFAQNCATAAETVQKSNNLLAANNQDNFFVTLFYGIIDFKNGTFEYCNAGHNPPAIIRNNGKDIEFLQSTGDLVTAIMPDIEYSQITIPFNKGDRLFLFTDGVTEAFNKNEELFGEARVLNVLNNTDFNKGVAENMNFMMHAIEEFVNGHDQSDDITAMFVHLKE